MILAKVIGNVVMSVKHKAYESETLLAVQPLDQNQNPTGKSWLALDRAQAGVGDTVLVLREGSGIRQILGRDKKLPVEVAVKEAVPVRSLIVGIVDAVSVQS